MGTQRAPLALPRRSFADAAAAHRPARLRGPGGTHLEAKLGLASRPSEPNRALPSRGSEDPGTTAGTLAPSPRAPLPLALRLLRPTLTDASPYRAATSRPRLTPTRSMTRPAHPRPLHSDQTPLAAAPPMNHKLIPPGLSPDSFTCQVEEGGPGGSMPGPPSSKPRRDAEINRLRRGSGLLMSKDQHPGQRASSSLEAGCRGGRFTCCSACAEQSAWLWAGRSVLGVSGPGRFAF
jgi:hypothetical protein